MWATYPGPGTSGSGRCWSRASETTRIRETHLLKTRDHKNNVGGTSHAQLFHNLTAKDEF